MLFPAITALSFLLIYGQIQPSYLPKGEIRRSQVIPFEQEHYEVKDLMLKPLSGETRDERIKKLYNEELPFIENKPLTKQN